MRDVVVVIPCHREPLDVVAKTVESARAVSLVTKVVLVSDGTGRDDLDGLPCEVVHRKENGGPAAALQTGVERQALDSIICRLDVGDSYYPEAKAQQIAEVLGGRCRASASPHYMPVRARTHEIASDWNRRIFRDCQFSTVTAVYERSVWERVDGFDPTLRWCEDWLFCIKVQVAIGWHIFPDVTCSAGMFPGGHSDVTADPARREARDKDYARVSALGLAYAEPERHKHLFDPTWCAKRGVRPLVKL